MTPERRLEIERERNADVWKGLELLRSTATPLLDADGKARQYLVSAKLLDVLMALRTAQLRNQNPGHAAQG